MTTTATPLAPPTDGKTKRAAAPHVHGVRRDMIASLGPMGLRGKLIVAALLAVIGWGAVAYIYQLRYGLSVTAMGNYISWGFYIINFVFFIGISHAGTLVSAILRVTGTGWRRPITRMAEGITAFALLVGAPMVIIDMGRPDRLLHVVLYGRLQSPILWDVLSVTTYLTGSLLYLYLPMIPDLAILRDHGSNFKPWRRWMYHKLALGWTGTVQQHRRLERAIAVMAVIIIPVAVSVHTVVSWVFGMTVRPGWHSTIFGPYFVVGAIFSGIAALLTAMTFFAWAFRPFGIHRYITENHFKKLGLLLLTVNLIYVYFTFSEYLTIGYSLKAEDAELLEVLFHGPYAASFWAMSVIGLFVPALMLALPWTRNIKGIFIASILINVGMWLKRYVIVVPTLASPLMPTDAVDAPWAAPLAYSPTWVEWSIIAGTFAGFALLYILFSKVFPIVSIWEIEEEQAQSATTRPAYTLRAEEELSCAD